MEEIALYLLVAATIFGVNLLPAFGPPTWSVLVLFSLHHDYVVPVLVLVGALSAASGRLVLARTTRRLERRLPSRQRDNLRAAGELLVKRKARSTLGLALFALSPMPSAQLFEAAGLIRAARLLPLTVAFFAGRAVSYSIYVTGTYALKSTDVGHVVSEQLTSVWGVLLQVLMLTGLVLLAQVDWSRFGGGR
ncbi:MAG TPA: hypothetical protein VF416_02845 [Marmoricola sp.]